MEKNTKAYGGLILCEKQYSQPKGLAQKGEFQGIVKVISVGDMVKGGVKEGDTVLIRKDAGLEEYGEFYITESQILRWA